MERNSEGSFLTVRRPSQGPHRGSAYHSASGAGAVGSTAWIGKSFSCVCAHGIESDAHFSFDITLSQEESLHKLQSRIEVVYDSSKKEHQECLRALWYAAYPGVELHGLVSEQWKDMGWQGKDPSTDFRGGGFISLENLLFFARSYPKSFQDLLQKLEGNRAMWETVGICFVLNILKNNLPTDTTIAITAAKPRSCIGAIFLKLLSENSQAFDILYCVTFKLMDQQWLHMHASYMDFNAVMKLTRCRLEKELLMEHVSRIEDLPSYSLLIP